MKLRIHAPLFGSSKKCTKSPLLLALTLFIAFISWSCSPESNPSPDSNGPVLGANLNGNGEHPWIETECTSRDTLDLMDGLGGLVNANYPSAYGIGEITNDPENIYWLITLGRDWYLEKVSTFIGDLNDVALTQNNEIMVDSMSYTEDLSTLVNRYYITIPKSQLLKNNNDIIFYGQVVRLNGFLGGVDQASRTSIWAKKNTFQNGQAFSYTFVPCGGNRSVSDPNHQATQDTRNPNGNNGNGNGPGRNVTGTSRVP